MSDRTSPEILKGLLEGDTQFALIDVREDGEFHFTHIPGASLVSRRQLEFLMPLVVPFNGARVVLCDDDGRRADLAAATLERMGYQRGPCWTDVSTAGQSRGTLLSGEVAFLDGTTVKGC